MATDCILWDGRVNHEGYGVVSVKSVPWLAHRLIWTRTNGPIQKGMVICHRCDNPPCVNLDHLFIGSQADNLADMTRKGRRRNGWKAFRGEENPASKLTAKQVKEIRLASGFQREIAARYGVSQSHVSDIKNHRRWA